MTEKVDNPEPQARGPLTDEIKRRIVSELATFRSTAQIREMLVEEYGREMTAQEVLRYDATKDYCMTGQPLRDLFHSVRKEYVEGTSDLHIASLAYRLRELQDMARKAKADGKPMLAASLLEQAAKDFGGAFTNERKLSAYVQHEHLSFDAARQLIEGKAAEARETRQ